MTNAAPLFLIDTNVLIYAYDAADPAKQGRAVDVLIAVHDTRSGALSVQVLGEFYYNITRKPKVPLTREQASATAIRLSRSWRVLDLNVRTFLDAVRAASQHQMSYWDALIWATASQWDIRNVVSEDQQDGRLIENVRFINPFQPSFDMARLA